MMTKTHKRFMFGLSLILALVFAAAAPAMRVFADVYNCDAYGAGNYQTNVCGASTEDGSGGLANTGQSVWPIILAVVMILAGTYMLYRTRKKMKQRVTSTQQR